MTLRLAILLLGALALVGVEPPTHVLRAGGLELRVHPFDAETGYYRGQRFDHGGMVAQATWHGQTVFGELREPRDPEAHDNVAGVVEEFGIDGALGYDEADPEGGTFVKIGVGVLQRNGPHKYAFSRRYPVAELPPWTVTVDATTLTSRQILSHGPWGYDFTKTIRVAADGNAFTVHHELRNTGSRPIVTDHYSHNNLRFGDARIGPDYVWTYPAPVAVARGRGPIVIDGAMVSVSEPLTGSLWVLLEGIPETDNRVAVTHGPSRMTLTISHDYAPAKVVVYAEPLALCPEHFVAIDLAPGATQAWTTTYAFSRAD